CRDVWRGRHALVGGNAETLYLTAGDLRGCTATKRGGEQIDLVAERGIHRGGAALEWHMRRLDLGDLLEEIFRGNMGAAADAGRPESDALALRRMDEIGECIGGIARTSPQRLRARCDEADRTR